MRSCKLDCEVKVKNKKNTEIKMNAVVPYAFCFTFVFPQTETIECRACRYRLYRDACMALEGNYLKDLNVLGRDLSKVAIVDNSPYAYGFQVSNSPVQCARVVTSQCES